MIETATTQLGRLPDFLIIGAAKSGTTSLHRYLDRHPDIYMSPKKEPCFFDADVAWNNGLDWYRSLFGGASDSQLCGEASTNYTRFPQVPEVPARIANTLPAAKFIYIMRHPVDRAYSHYVHRYTKEVYPGRPFEQSFEQFVARDPMCLDSSDYLLQIEQYLRYFPAESFLWLFFEELKSDPASVVRKVLRFLDVDDRIDLLGASPIAANTASRSLDHRRRAEITKPLRNNPLIRTLAYSVPQSWRDRGYRILKKMRYGRRISKAFTPAPMQPETRQALIERFSESNQQLAELIGMDLPDWCQN